MTPAGFEPTIPTSERPRPKYFLSKINSVAVSNVLPIAQDMEISQHMWFAEILVSLICEIESIRGLKRILGIAPHWASRARRQKY